jgi:hypothetical protein
MLIAQGSDVVFTSRQLGHAYPAITMRIYANAFGTAAFAAKVTAGLKEAFGGATKSGSEVGSTQPVAGTITGDHVLSAGALRDRFDDLPSS